jgi:hypothetical protein
MSMSQDERLRVSGVPASEEAARLSSREDIPLVQALERTIERQVTQRTWGRIQALEVKVCHNLVVVRGRAPSYYVVQLALQGALDVIEPAGAMRIELNIQVGSPPKSAREGL